MFEKKMQGSIYSKGRDKISWKVPALFKNDEVVFLLIEMFNELGLKLNIKSVFGSMKCAWNGGRPSQGDDISEQEAFDIISRYNKNGISCCFTFSNYHIEPKDLDDKMGNLLLNVASKSGNENYAIVSSEILADYIRKNYPNIKLISSILKPVYEINNYQDTPEYYNELCTRYEKVVIRPEFCTDMNFMKKLKYKDKIEIMPNLGCLKRCLLARQHYDTFPKIEAGEIPPVTYCNKEMNRPEAIYKTNLLYSEDIDKLIKLGFTNFKLKGRNFSDQQFIYLLGDYIFESTGAFQHIKKQILHKLNIVVS